MASQPWLMVLAELWPCEEPRSLLVFMLSEAQGAWSSSTLCGPWLQDARNPDHSTLAATVEA